MNTILVATDFSDNGSKAVKYAAHMALRLNSQLVILNVYHIPLGSEAGQAVPADVFREIEDASNQDLCVCENEIKRDVSNDLKIVKLVACGFAADEILVAAADYKADVIVVGAHGQSGLEKIFGSVTTSVLRKSTIPVLAVPANADFEVIKKIVIASHGMEGISRKAKELLDKLIVAFHPEFFIADVLSKTVEYAENQKQFGPFVFTQPEIITEENEDVALGINNVIDRTGADLLVMFPEKHSFMYRLMNVENTKKMATITHIPLLAILKENN